MGFLLALFAFGQAGSALAQDRCDALRGFASGNAIILSTESVAGPGYKAPDSQTYDQLGAFCRVVARATPAPQSNILIEIWLPASDHWNGKLLGTGNGGFAGSVRYAALAGGVRRGYAVANTDMGTFPAGSLGAAGYDAGIGRPEAVRDWGSRATHEMALATRAVAKAYYDRDASRSYFAGCSTGGHQGLTEAQRYPEDYDAIIAGAPGHNRTHLHMAFTWFGQAGRMPGAHIPAATMTAWATAVNRSCVGKDGGAPGDAFLTQPLQCRFAPRDMLCKPGQVDGSCLTTQQAAVLDRIYGGVRNPRTGKLIYPAEMKGTEALLAYFFGDPELAKKPVAADLARWVFGGQYDAASFDFDKDVARMDAALGADVNANDPELTRFAARGGKLILYHGWSDLIVSPLDSIIYYTRIRTGQGAPSREQFSRLFMAPGVSHCAGGLGPDRFGQGVEFKSGDAEHDLLAALDTWVETGKAPDQIIATKVAGADNPFAPPVDGPVVATRPVCAYPKVARYDGKGDAKDAKSFTCVAAPRPVFEWPAPEYLQ
ncbi:tannase/feruloyl esterase family alpha/beta hydrolase [Sphingobium rhizovicinum]|uniref:Tannase/feruloyl esterase family alpha/beta hydrolase n=1 Tax=Sphingobium rhizovicinum TaxID=432308 RepID=A0ABV7NLT7_9SPHN